MLAEKETATVTSHQWSLKFKTFRTKTNTQEMPTAIKKNAFSLTDHLPNVVVGIKFVFIFLLYYIIILAKVRGLRQHLIRFHP